MTSGRIEGLLIFGVGALLTAAGTALPVSPAVATVSSDSITVAADVVRAGALVPVTVTSLTSAAACRISIVGPVRSRTVVVKVRNYEAKTRFRVPAVAPGEYRVRAACGRDGTALSEPFRVVATGSPITASCDVTESGFSLNAAMTTATFGTVLANRSPDLTATNVELALTWRDASGNVVKTSSLYAQDIPPGRSVLAAAERLEAPAAASVSVAALCKTGESSALAPIDGTGTTRRDSDNELMTTGQFTNTSGATISASSEIVLLLRNGSGAIVGGDTANLDSFVLPAGVGTWSAYSGYYYPGTAPTVQAMLFPLEKT